MDLEETEARKVSSNLTDRPTEASYSQESSAVRQSPGGNDVITEVE
jgi:hypothetical protein